MIHIYEGNGKGKTSCAAGLALRALGRGIPVIFAQFMKDGSSGEIRMLEQLDHVTVVRPKVFYGFLSRMDREQRQATAEASGQMLAALASRILQHCNDPRKSAETEAGQEKTDNKKQAEISTLLVLDEALNAVSYGLLSGSDLLDFLDRIPDDMEVILTGRSSSPELKKKADYITSFDKLKHPYDKGIKARAGIEY